MKIPLKEVHINDRTHNIRNIYKPKMKGEQND